MCGQSVSTEIYESCGEGKSNRKMYSIINKNMLALYIYNYQKYITIVCISLKIICLPSI